MASRGTASAAGQPSILSFFRPNNKNPAPVVQPPKQQQQPPLPPPPPPAPLQSPSPGAVAAAAAASSSLAAPTPPATTPHPSASIVPITADHIAPLRRINALLLCVNYPDSFYQRILDPAASGLFSRAILWSETEENGDPASSAEPPKVIGSIVARVETSPFDKNRSALYIQSLTLLSPFRSLGLARAALDAVLDHARHLRSAVDIADVYAHVWTENDDGLRWYAARGFERVGSRPEQGYYHKLRPDTAWIVRRSLDGAASASDISAAMARTTAAAAGAPRPAVVPPSVTAAVVNLPPKAPPVPASSASAKAAALCFQDKRPEMDWNDLPPDVAAGLLTPGSGQGSEASSRSSSTARGPKKKRDRAYPAAAFGS
ncbi:hypothetical protein PspLS_08121 [Pyricularia sp. CBS 133598]|nr:hypothetical protein PspLS_08121 [Pyricularia sp. CBS 133598]